MELSNTFKVFGYKLVYGKHQSAYSPPGGDSKASTPPPHSTQSLWPALAVHQGAAWRQQQQRQQQEQPQHHFVQLKSFMTDDQTLLCQANMMSC